MRGEITLNYKRKAGMSNHMQLLFKLTLSVIGASNREFREVKVYLPPKPPLHLHLSSLQKFGFSFSFFLFLERTLAQNFQKRFKELQ